MAIVSRLLPAWCPASAVLTLAWLGAAAPAAARVPTGVLRQDTGRIDGMAVIAPVLTATHRRIRVYDEPGTPPPQPSPSAAGALANVVVYLDRAPALRSATPEAAAPVPSLHQRDETFVPHVLPIVAGTVVEFPNDDPLFHNVFSLSSTRTFDLARYPQGASRTVVFNRPGVVEVFCHIHADMSAYILVLDNAFFTTPDSAGHFTLGGVPPGDYRLVAWYERAHPVVLRVHVDAGRTTHQDVRIPIPASE